MAARALEQLRARTAEVNRKLEERRGLKAQQISEVEKHFSSLIDVHQSVWKFSHHLRDRASRHLNAAAGGSPASSSAMSTPMVLPSA